MKPLTILVVVLPPTVLTHVMDFLIIPPDLIIGDVPTWLTVGSGVAVTVA